MTNPESAAYLQEHTEVKKQLQKSYTVLQQCVQVWKDACAESSSSIQSIINLTEQYHSCSNVQTCDLPYSEQFPDIKDKLLYKISLEIDKHFSVLKKIVDQMKQCSEKMNKQYDQCMAHCNRKCGVNDLPSVTMATACFPSITAMLEWIEISDRQLRNSFLCKEHLLVSYSPEEEGITDSWVKHWDDTACISKIEGYLASTHYFQELNLT